MDETKITVPDILQYVADKFCDEYCKYPEQTAKEHPDGEDAEAFLYDTYCAKCPLNRLV